MKSGLILGTVAAVLFALTAGLSIWLNPTKAGDDSTLAAKSAGRKDGTSAGDKDGSAKAVVHATPRSESLQSAAQLKDDLVHLAQREEEFDREKDLHRFLLDDVRDEMEDLQKLFQKAAEAKRKTDSPSPGQTAPKPTLDPGARKTAEKPATEKPGDNMRTAAGISESMQPENTARLLEQMAKGGKIDAAVQLLTKMSPRQAAKVLGLISDEKLSVQLFEKLMEAQKPVAPAKP